MSLNKIHRNCGYSEGSAEIHSKAGQSVHNYYLAFMEDQQEQSYY